ncbi:hypothetical protein E0H85_03695 [Acinetobacter terrae]|uniref:Type IV toxin-antitoxin system AbiEi family antitoxin domain-containing protein n=1 Tax=Acinetobacter terrae TaxID=2731247 RepID=A0A4R0ER41_9GAMM|nr:hypothetical protein E0H85_03695 [Acinetobacter terrae]
MNISNTISANVRETVAGFAKGRVFTIEDISIELEVKQVVQRTLSHLIEEGSIRRIYNGIYYKPEVSRILKSRVFPPNIDQTVKVISAKNNEIIQMHGALACNRLGLSTQMPMAKVFHTNGFSREIEIGGARIKFLHTNNDQLLQYAGTKVGIAISALHYLGRGYVNIEVVEKIRLKLTSRDFRRLQKASLPAWIKKTFNSLAHS